MLSGALDHISEQSYGSMGDNKQNRTTIKYHISLREFLKSLGVRHILMFLLMPTFLLFLIFLNFRMVYSLAADNIEYGGEYRIKGYSVAYEDYLEPGLQLMEYVAYNVEHMFKTGASNEEILEFFGRESDSYAREVNVDSTGVYGYVNGEYMDGSGWIPDADYVPTQRPWYIDAMKSDEEVSYIAPYIDSQTGDMVMTIARRLPDGSSVVAIDIKINDLNTVTEELVARDDGDGAVLVLDEDGAVVTHSDGSQVGMNYLETGEEPAYSIAQEVLVNKAERFEVAYDGGTDIFFSRPIGGGWYVISQTDSKEALSRVFDAAFGSLLAGICGTLAIFAVLIVMTFRRIKSDNLTANLETVSGIYVCIYKMNLVEDTFEEISCQSDDIAQLIAGRRMKARNTLYELVEGLTDERSRGEMARFTDLDTLSDRMKSNDVLTIEFMNHKDIWCRGRFISAERDKDGALVSVIWMIEYIDEEKRARDRLLYLSETDTMTGINNRGCGENRIRRQLVDGDGGMFILLDVDNFKSFNDRFGHDVGDQVLIAIANCMKKAFRDNDIIMRLGGDEFAAFIPNVYSAEGGGGIIIDRFLECVRAIRIKALDGEAINVSVGVSFYRVGDRFTFDELYKRADKCTYESKGANGTRVTYYNEQKVS